MTATATTSDDTLDPVVQLNLSSPLLLGSTSTYRKMILNEMNLKHHIFARPIDEKALGDRSKNSSPDELVLTIAHAKMDHLVQEFNKERNETNKHDGADDDDNGKEKLPKAMDECILLTGDQVVTCNGNILEKPVDVVEAKKMIGEYADYPPSTVGSCVLHHLPTNVRVAGVDTATIHFLPTIAEVDVIVDQMMKEDENPSILSCCGALVVEHPSVQERLDHIDGTQDSVMGLSKDLVLRLLKELKDKLSTAPN